MRRREFIAALGSAAAWPLGARAQQRERLRRIGILWPQRESDPVRKTFDAAIRQGLAERGWVEGRSLQIDMRYVGEHPENVGVLIKELIELRPEILVTGTVRLTRAMQEQTRTIPIVMMGAGDPLASGLVKSLSRPDGNTTGVTDIFPSIGGKWLELLRECVPDLEQVAVIFNPDRASVSSIWPAVKAAEASGVKLIETKVRSAEEIEHAIVGLATSPRSGLIILPPPFLPAERQLINRLAVQYRLPVIYQDRAFALEGGLLSYGADMSDMFRNGVPPYIDRILHGATPGDLPVQFPTKFSLVLNLKTAKAMGLTVPAAFLNIADEVIE
jgi:putative tryptophan/tyrosine transport system substrate-binding protein